MTTNAYDKNLGVMATDSRWSINYRDYILYLDNTGYNKIEVIADYIYMFAGDGVKIQEWKNWLRSAPNPQTIPTDYKGINIGVADRRTKDMDTYGNGSLNMDDGFFAGSGTLYAFTCWYKNRDPKKSVETAKNHDDHSGGEVKFYEINSNASNLNYPQHEGDIISLGNAIMEKGKFIMNKRTTSANSNINPSDADSVLKIEDYAIIKEKVANGELRASAPFDGMENDWSESDKERFKRHLAKAYGW